MMGPRQEAQAALFYEFSLEEHVPQDHRLRSIDRFVNLSSIPAHLADIYSHSCGYYTDFLNQLHWRGSDTKWSINPALDLANKSRRDRTAAPVKFDAIG